MPKDAMGTPETEAVLDLKDGDGPVQFAYVFQQLTNHARKLERQRDALMAALQRYVNAYPAFRMKPIGAEGSPARIEQENLMAIEEQAKAALSRDEGEK